METIKEGKQYLMDNVGAGISCPCCNQFVKLYKNPLEKASLIGLILIYKHTVPGELIHANKLFNKYAPNNTTLTGGGNFSKLKHWGLLKATSDRQPDTGAGD